MFKISDEKIKDMIRVADEKEKEYLCSMTPISSLIFCFWSFWDYLMVSKHYLYLK